MAKGHSAVIDEPANDFDVGPLSWVQAEIDQALARGVDALAAFSANPNDGTPLKHARTHVHQAAGAIQMVGLDAVVAFTDELERHLTRLEDLPIEAIPEAVALVDRACRKLKIFLDELVSGASPVPLKLYPEYEAMQHARGVRAVAPTDLFYPELSAKAPRIPPREVVPQNRMPSHMVKQRRIYQRGLLAWLRGNEDGAKTMRDAIAGIEDVTSQSSLRSFWWTVGALLEAVTERGVETGFGVKQLAARIDLQIRRVAEGGAKVADRLRREVLYFIAISAPVAPQVQAVQRAYRLSGLIPTAEVIATDVVGLQPLIREAREQLAQAKDTWLKFASGRAENLPKLKSTLASVHAKAAQMKQGALMKLTAALVERLDKLPASGVPEALAMEYATALLLAESAFENHTNLAPEFPQQVQAMVARLDAARSGRTPAGGAPMLDEMSKRAQERMLLAQVGREIQNNLRHMEQVLDGFFRDNGKRAELATLAKDSAQIRGALTILNLPDAERLLAMCQAQIETYADPDTPVDNDDLELLAESLSGLGFYIEAVEQQRPERERLIAPLIAKRMGEAAKPLVEERDSVERAVDELRAKLPSLVDQVHRAPSDEAARASLREKLSALHDDAELIGDAELAAQASAALKGLEAGGTVELAAVVEAIADTSAPTPELSDETQRLLEVDAKGLDAELLDIYLTEAVEVLDGIRDSAHALDTNVGDRDALATVRRGFHTLKGSGRMVGLTELGEFAYDVEKLFNRLLDEERAVTPAVLELTRVAQRTFHEWVGALRDQGRVTPDPKGLHDAIRAVEAELPGRESVIAAPPKSLAAGPAAAGPLLTVVGSQPSSRSIASELAGASDDAPIDAPPEAEVFELPALGEATIDGPTIEFDAVDEGTEAETFASSADEGVGELAEWSSPEPEPANSTPSLKLVADNTRPLVSITPFEPPHLSVAPPGEPDALAEPESEPDEVAIGNVTLSTTLWRILVDEAMQHLAALEHELGRMQNDATLEPSSAMIRASHTLCGIHRTGGFEVVAAQANRLELTLIALAQRGAPLATAAYPVIARTIANLRAFVTALRERMPIRGSDEIEAQAIAAELDDLRQTGIRAHDAPITTHAITTQAITTHVAVAHERRRQDAPVVELRQPMIAPPADVASRDDMPQADGARQPEEAVEDPLAGMHDEVEDTTVLAIFLDEATDLLSKAGEALRTWRRAPDNADAAHALRRDLHTFKGSARMAGAMRLGELAHLMESRLIDGDRLVTPSPERFEALDTDLDRVTYVLNKLRDGETNVALPWMKADGEERPAPETAYAAHADEKSTKPAVDAATAGAAPAVAFASSADPEAAGRAMLRVRADTIDRLVNEAGEVAISRARVEGELRSLKANLLELTSSVIRLRNQVREIEIQAESQIQSRMTQMQEHQDDFDPLEFDRFTRFQELTRSLAEGVNDVSTVQQSLLKNLDDADAALLAQARLSREVQQKLFAIRTVPFGSVSERLYRIMRSVAKELDKRANLEIVGGKTELDRSVLEKLVGPLEHLLRNALDHGVESREARRAAGKPEQGEITVTVRQAGNEVAIELADDGAGVDLERIREKAQAQGLLVNAASATDGELYECMFKPGFSTATKLTSVSGRGVGMDVVRAEITALGGRVDIASEASRGTRFTLSLPLTLAVAQAVLVRAGGRLWALPAPMVEQVQQVREQALLDLYVKREVEWKAKRYPFHYLPRLLGDTSHEPETQRYNAVVLLRTGQGTAAIHVDEMVGNQEVVVKNIGPQLARVSGISGATVLGTGEIVLIIHPVQLAQRAGAAAREAEGARLKPVSAAAVVTRPRVLIVDDSLTVRKITSRLLTREGFDVLTAKDGVDALKVLSDHVPDAILLDIEMPRMDGFEFTRTMKNDAKLSGIPIIVITSRTADKHRARAAELGVDVYLGKPYQEEELLRHLRETVKVGAAV
ncbi:MAG TPA: Hpt domain-containing protein [Casimicrobiaceae bacterium]|nr:Hpt domain-containing protein [Casimicrobiaceae bacterium]